MSAVPRSRTSIIVSSIDLKRVRSFKATKTNSARSWLSSAPRRYHLNRYMVLKCHDKSLPLSQPESIVLEELLDDYFSAIT